MGGGIRMGGIPMMGGMGGMGARVPSSKCLAAWMEEDSVCNNTATSQACTQKHHSVIHGLESAQQGKSASAVLHPERCHTIDRGRVGMPLSKQCLTQICPV